MQHLVGLHAYGVSDVPPGSEPDEQRKKMDSDPDSSSTMACVWWRNPQCPMSPIPVCQLQTWEPHQREREGKGEETDQQNFSVFFLEFSVYFSV